jgi:hypothetical protein
MDISNDQSVHPTLLCYQLNDLSCPSLRFNILSSVRDLMADAVSLFGLAAGLILLGLQVSEDITKYLDAMECHGEEIAFAQGQSRTLASILRLLEKLLPKVEPEYHAPNAVITVCFEICEKGLRALESLVVRISSTGIFASGVKGRLKNQAKKLR